MVDDHKKRELRQLWFGVDLYLELSEELRKQMEAELDHTTQAVADAFTRDVPCQESPEYRLAALGAHLASAGIRLGSIHEVLSPDNPNRCRNLLRNHNSQEIARELDNDLSNCISTLLRDNVAHVDGNNALGVQREKYLEKKTFRQLYKAVLQDAEDTAKQLRDEGVLEQWRKGK